MQHARFCAQEGVRITDIGFTNEPDLATSYASMRLTPAQAAELAETVGPVVTSAGIGLVCCDVSG